MTQASFLDQMTVQPDRAHAGRYRAELSEAWNCPLVPHGGVVTALAARAMAHELEVSDHQLRSITAVFAARVPAGPVEIDVDVLRRGRSMSQVTATVRAVGEEAGHTSLAVFGGSRPGFEFTDTVAPEVPPVEECSSFRDPRPEGVEEGFHFNFWDHVEGRPALGHAPWDDYAPTSSERASWYRFDEPPRLDDGTLDPLALVALCDTMPGAVDERMGPGAPRYLPPSADLTVHVLGEARSEWILAGNRARHAGDGYASLEIELWDPAGGLVAYGTQVAFFTFPEDPPSPEQVRPPG